MKHLLIATALLGLASTSLAQVSLTGAGATFPFPVLSKYFDEYLKVTNGQVRVNYQSIGSGGGQRQLIEQTVHFGVSDNPFNDQQMADIRRNSGSPALNIPFVLGAVVPTYNLPGVTQRLNFTGEVLADIFLGNIKTWNDPAIARLNPGVNLPALPITVVHRSDGSGTTFVWTDYLTKVSPEWAQKVGRGNSVNWLAPNKVGGRGNEGVAGVVRNTPGAIGYNEVTYAVQNRIQYGAVQNKAGRFIVADLPSITAAANVVLPGDARISLTNTNAPDGYPVSSFSYILTYEQLDKNKAFKSEAEARAFVQMLKWVVTEGQKFNEPLTYARLTEVAQARALALISRITYQGKPIGKEIVGQ
ncbi:MAG: phosphate ABC transporter substrate-binding protein PstS [Meiothermus sp.]|uniref:phosphate ABC transporter substrate-binding protein PstS n=1 Tax=Meiothermus sp. TaxID=1955249 RepID=UPI0025F2A28C|nr:phosphate ABC transporter substrate-binding protein PstS [Meiothermus sp.]MCS7057893.1 phosphate ABC transporter substrate-binding protein PstS [Meiothermus sp.]MCS7194231.1 phosphate ABC transporter substrate-binding protein PstS [Meiothermus sp.]MCX7740479.1 phosphate ABC transporter substrate-binding protein PstS [Meiothermus sp.]MDW8090092.1 phosphate ABC transporter substrate-binding protein PstS [Meiothermus sp.]MDW8480742.1 phosphate ABC transporter substrate-binding protein PstS [Me